MDRQIFGKGKQTVGKAPAVALINPKDPRNVAQVIRACSCFGIEQCWFTGNRAQINMNGLTRLPREERMKGYSKVDLIQYDYPFEQFPDATPIGIEVMEGAEMMTTFEHPENAIYVFGPEDGGLSRTARSFCHRFVFIPMAHCANLAASVYITLYDRRLKRSFEGLEKPMTVSDVLEEPRGWSNFEEKFYGNGTKSFKNVPIDKMLGVDEKV